MDQNKFLAKEGAMPVADFEQSIDIVNELLSSMTFEQENAFIRIIAERVQAIRQQNQWDINNTIKELREKEAYMQRSSRELSDDIAKFSDLLVGELVLEN